jgi:uncharacterized membrane protein YtjA (UPF0391 family)
MIIFFVVAVVVGFWLISTISGASPTPADMPFVAFVIGVVVIGVVAAYRGTKPKAPRGPGD